MICSIILKYIALTHKLLKKNNYHNQFHIMYEFHVGRVTQKKNLLK